MDTYVLWHGSQRWEGPPEHRPAAAKRMRFGPGLYLTTSPETAKSYAKGGGKILRFEVDSRLTFLNETKLDVADMIAWVQERERLKNKKLIIADLLVSAERRKSPMIAGFVLENLLLAHESLSGSHGPALADWYVSQGVDASLVKKNDEDWRSLSTSDSQVQCSWWPTLRCEENG